MAPTLRYSRSTCKDESPSGMRTRLELIKNLSTIDIPGGVEPECSLPCAARHIYCRACIIQWFSMKDRNTCPTCREELFTVSEADRGPTGDERLRLVAQAFQNSGLQNMDDTDVFHDELVVDVLAVQRAAAEAYNFLAAESHPPPADGALVDMKTLAPHIIAMGSLIRGYAQAAGRPYSGYQRRVWRIIVGRLIDMLILTHGQAREGQDVKRMAREYRARVKESLMQDLIDIESGRFFEVNARLDSPCGDFGVLLHYMAFQCQKTFAERKVQQEELARDQEAALQEETTSVGYGMRWLGQRLFGGV